MSDPQYSQLELQHFDAVLGAKPFYSVRDVVRLLDLSDQTVVDMTDDGQLLCHTHNGGTGKRMTRRIPRHGIVLYLLKTKTYTAETYLAGLLGLLRELSPAGLAVVAAQLPELLAHAHAQTRSGIAQKAGVGGPLPRGNGQFAPK